MLTTSGGSVSNTESYTGYPSQIPVYDVNTRIQQLFNLLNQIGKSGYVDEGPIVKEILRLSGFPEAYRELSK